MTGKTHYKAGILYYLIFALTPLVLIPEKLLQKNSIGISISGIAVAWLAALLPDMDSQNSKINQMNPITGSSNRLVELMEKLLAAAIKLVFTVGSGTLIFYYSKSLIIEFSKFPFLKPYSSLLVYALGAFMILAGTVDSQVLKSIPGLGSVYSLLLSGIKQGANTLKRLALLLFYSTAGAGLIVFNFTHTKNFNIYLIGMLLIAVAVFPHRSFLHSLEGFILFSYCANYVFERIGHPELSFAFIVGYGSHLYMTDVLTKEGVPLLYLPKLILKLGFIRMFLKKVKLHAIVDKVTKIRVCIPLMSTGTVKGNLFEAVYIWVLVLIAVFTAIY